jgi:IS30 family transposase
MCYRHLIQEERYQISALLQAGFSQAAIGAKLSRSPSSVSREPNRNRVVGPYPPQVAGWLAAARSQRSSANAGRVPVAAWEFAREKLAETWSRQQIAAHRRVQHLPRLSHETIYRRIDEDKRAGGRLHLALRVHKQRRKRRGVRERRGAAPSPPRSNRTSTSPILMPPGSVAPTRTSTALSAGSSPSTASWKK